MYEVITALRVSFKAWVICVSSTVTVWYLPSYLISFHMQTNWWINELCVCFLWLSECTRCRAAHGNVRSLKQESCGFWHGWCDQGQRPQGESWAETDTKPRCSLMEFERKWRRTKECLSFVSLCFYAPFLLSEDDLIKHRGGCVRE